MKMIKSFGVGEGADLKLFGSKEEAQAFELAGKLKEIFPGVTALDSGALAIVKRADEFIDVLKGKPKRAAKTGAAKTRKPKTDKAAAA